MRPDEPDQRQIAQEMTAELRRLRAEHRDARIATELIRLDETIVVIRASIELPNGGGASGFGATASGGPAAVEAAEERALLRALAALGYGDVESPRPQLASVPAPVVEPTPIAPFVPEITRVPVQPEPEPEQVRVARQPAAPAPVAPSPPPPSATPAPIEDDLEMADYSWTEFWRWAKTTAYPTKAAVEELIGQPIISLNPAQVRNLIRAKGGIE
jgi:hypothetical protein